jgi:hypothetical protein
MISFGRQYKGRTPVLIDNRKIGFIHMVLMDPTDRACKPTSKSHMWTFADERTDPDFRRDGINGFVLDCQKDRGRSMFKQKLSLRRLDRRKTKPLPLTDAEMKIMKEFTDLLAGL